MFKIGEYIQAGTKLLTMPPEPHETPLMIYFWGLNLVDTTSRINLEMNQMKLSWHYMLNQAFLGNRASRILNLCRFK